MQEKKEWRSGGWGWGQELSKRRKGRGERKEDKSDTEQGDRKERFRI